MFLIAGVMDGRDDLRTGEERDGLLRPQNDTMCIELLLVPVCYFSCYFHTSVYHSQNVSQVLIPCPLSFLGLEVQHAKAALKETITSNHCCVFQTVIVPCDQSLSFPAVCRSGCSVCVCARRGTNERAGTARPVHHLRPMHSKHPELALKRLCTWQRTQSHDQSA
jgi:hypothetical protein